MFHGLDLKVFNSHNHPVSTHNTQSLHSVHHSLRLCLLEVVLTLGQDSNTNYYYYYHHYAVVFHPKRIQCSLISESMLAIAGYKLSGRMLALEDNQMHLEVRTTGVFVLFLFLSALMLTSGYI